MMKRLLLAFTAIIMSASTFAQISHDLEIFSEDGMKFTLILNGRVMNETPVSSIQILNTDKDYLNAKIRFEDTGYEDIVKKNLQLAYPSTDEAQKNTPVTVVYKIVEKKGNMKLRFASRSAKKIQEQVIINQTVEEGAGVEITNGKLTIRW
jgi:ABC-type glutathione transport system ATPase component